MIAVQRANERGTTAFGWLDSKHSFSFGYWYDPTKMGVSKLRVLNDDRVSPGAGFPTHGHRDMEIVSYVVEGKLEHRDSMGNGSVLEAGDVQRMTAGTGVSHSEFNASRHEPVRFLQIWFPPHTRGLDPGYEEKRFGRDAKLGKLSLLVSPGGDEGSLSIHQDIRLYATILRGGEQVSLDLAPGRNAWVQVVRGVGTVDGLTVEEGDGVRVADQETLALGGPERGEVELLIFDLP